MFHPASRKATRAIGIVELTANSLSYRHHAFDIDNFLTAEEKKLPLFADFHAYLKEVFDQSNNLLLSQHLLKEAAKDLPEAAVIYESSAY
ncbi:hypothetical protein [Lactobacillus delbrueckii]|uniref:hypothetical protein n=1 Tax=Lactobacillus delbrueckii TaxID=1584 RepID=UPI0006F12AFB|nr:hypothetical protein [Lactobacillus delbrueckii]KRL72218.1 hypothetical protein FC09_GL001439 [Lactobacillus delbrueckii subsp. indicus DSM 15996]